MSKQPRPDLLEELFELQSEECENEETLLLPPTRQCKRAEFTEASTPTMLKRPRPNLLEELFELQSEECENEETLLLPPTRQCKRAELTETSTLNMSTQPTPDLLEELFELQSEEGESEETLLLPSTRQRKRAEFTETSTPTMSKQPRPDLLEELFELQSGEGESEENFLLPSSDSLEKINVLSESGANSWPSASSTSVIGNNYHVFLSFRGPDTRKNLVDHLYHRFKDVGLKFHPNFVFRDDESIPFGEDIAANLLSAIERSKVSIPVISENYAASEWCLRELIHIMECKESRGQIVLPVLYKVKRKDVKHMLGKFGEAFKSTMDRFKEDVKQQGPEALKKALTLRVYESEKFASGHEGELVNSLVQIILHSQREDFKPCLTRNLVGIEDHVAEVMKLVGIAHPDTRIIWIWGIGGIGKTTLATIIYNKLFDKFQYHSFLKDIRETISRKGIEHVQSQLISNTIKIHDYSVHDLDEGINMIQSSCTQKKVLFLLDDVDHEDHLNNLIGGCKFSPGSRIVVTCRQKSIKCQDKAMLESTYCYELREMNYKNSLLLFSIHAFEGKPPPKELATLSRDIVATTGGLPLALKVIGSLLKEKEDQRVWRETLKELSKAPHMTVHQKLKVSYDALKYEEQQMFLDIACFLVGTNQRIATYLWDDLEFSPISGLARMVELSLIKFDEENELTMHDQLRDLGKAIAHPVNKKPWDWSRLWDEEAMKVLRRKEENENIEALCLDERGSREFIKQESFKKMPNLKFLHVKDVDFDGDFKGSLAELRWLKWEGCCDSFEATNFHLEKLVILDLSGDGSYGRGISENWRGWSSIKMERLKVLNLSWCTRLKSTPNLSAFKNLEMLILEHCMELEEIDPSIRDVKCLVSLNLTGCWSFKKLPEQLGELEKMEELVVSHTQIKEIPPCIGSLKKLKRLSTGWGCGAGSSLVRMPSSIGKLGELVRIPSSIGKLGELVRIPSSIGKLGELLELELSRSSIKELPESIGELKKLKNLKIFHSNIKRLPSSIGKLQNLQELDASGCPNLEGQVHVDKGGLSSLKTLCLRHTKISGLPENLDQLHSLEHLDLRFCRELESLPKPPCSLSSLWLTCRSNELPSLSHLKHLQELWLLDCGSLQSIPELPSCIRMLRVARCPKLERLPNLFDLEFLSKLWLVECEGLKKLDGLEALNSLRELYLRRLPPKFFRRTEPELSNLDGFDEKPDDLHAIEGLEKLGSLEVVDISERNLIQVLDLSKSEHLKELIVRDCKSLVEIRCPSKFLEYFNRDGCESLKKLPDFLPHNGPWLDRHE